MSKIYTKTGDQGVTGLYGGKRLPKFSVRVDTYGDLDELNAIIGIIISKLGTDSNLNRLLRIQSDLMIISSIIATPKDAPKNLKTLKLLPTVVEELEVEIDDWTQTLPSLTNFTLPGGTELSAFVHLSRAVCRRVERKLSLLNSEEEVDSIILAYINRLSDWLFTLARIINMQAGTTEIIWDNK